MKIILNLIVELLVLAIMGCIWIISFLWFFSIGRATQVIKSIKEWARQQKVDKSNPVPARDQILKSKIVSIQSGERMANSDQFTKIVLEDAEGYRYILTIHPVRILIPSEDAASSEVPGRILMKYNVSDATKSHIQ